MDKTDLELEYENNDEYTGEIASTKRSSSVELENILFKKIKVLDHGFIRVIDYMGDDSAVVQAARVSYGKGTKLVNQDKSLIYYLMRHRHTTPFEMCEIKLHVKLPIFIARQWIRHRTASVNEYSARYSILSKEYYLPNEENICSQSDTNKQGRSKVVPKELAHKVLEILRNDSERCYENYSSMLNRDELGNEIKEGEIGISRELARMNLTLNYYTEWYWKINLHNLLHFVNLRADTHAQYEIREYANAILSVIEKWVPLTYGAFTEYRMGSVNLSKSCVEIVKRMLSGENVNYENSGLSSKREWSEFVDVFLNK
jgi:thymidylate synthase (FAD)